ncbi:MAG: hypothetical protein H6662_07625 [Ardenticatenaceae bacterium]|nr:hypothetical protein [Anaerolineales bacterium]MCB8921433.1 hypothetical protein [Ardenticatenaceae bacterium]MCB8991550.1 hypothetical protein [Ardenticatenaceae bacterium]MCB9005088.1 hypothetical protein [Ardenticatenaceae bacterium]
MSAMRRAAILKLASAAYEMKLDVMNGVLSRHENGRWQLGTHDLLTWLERHEGEDLVLVLGSMEDERPVEVRTCGTCGRDYTELECPYCRANRIRLRGRA